MPKGLTRSSYDMQDLSLTYVFETRSNYVAQAGFELEILPLQASQVLGLQACTTAQQKLIFKRLILFYVYACFACMYIGAPSECLVAR